MNNRDWALWIGVIGVFLIGDIVTTYVGIRYHFMSESTEIYRSIYFQYGLSEMLVVLFGLKVIVLTIGLSMWQYFNHYLRYTIPLSLGGSGLYATVWNGLLIL